MGFLIWRSPCWATDRFVRTDGSNTTNCTGLANAAYDGSGTGEACALSNPADAITAAACGDTIKVLAGNSFDTTGLTVPNKSCSVGTPITITSTASLAARRQAPGDASLMPRFRTTSTLGAGAFITAANASYWILDGLEITDNAGSNLINTLVDIGLTNAGAHHITVQRCYIHQKETGVNYERAAMRGIWVEGNNNTIKWNYIGPMIGYFYGQLNGTPMTTMAYQNVGASVGNLLEDNYMDAWYSPVFTGGADSAPTHSSAMSAANTTTATLSDVTGIAIGTMLRFELRFTATVAFTGGLTATLTRTAGQTLVDPGDVAIPASDIFKGAIVFPTSGSDAVADVVAIAGNVYTINYATSSTQPADGSWLCVMYKTAIVTNVAGNVVTYSPYETGYSALNQNPDLTSVSWVAGGEGNTADFTIRRNTINIDSTFVAYNWASGSGGSPKGYWEMKSAYNLLVDGNYFTGGPSGIAWTGNNQNGTAPWIVVKHVTFTNNWFEPDAVGSARAAQSFIMTTNPYKTTAPGEDILFQNNLFKNISVMGIVHPRMNNVRIIHNTIINNTGSSGGAYNAALAGTGPSSDFVFKDNIVFYSSNGMSCQLAPNTLATCWPSGIFLNNVAVDNTGQGFNGSVWGSGSVLGPIPTTIAGIGFTNEGAEIYSLAGSSDFKNDASDGTDPGVNWTALLTALGQTSGSSSAVSGKVTMSGKVVVN